MAISRLSRTEKERHARIVCGLQKTQRSNYLTPRMEEGMDLLGEAMISSTLDGISGYWEVEIAK